MSDISHAPASSSRPNLRRSIVVGLGAAAIAATFATPAAGAQPNHQACLGEDIRSYAQGGSQFGGFVAGMAVGDGVATEILAHLAGEVPDEVIPNSCND